MTTALIFPGQGSQTIGMGKDLYDTFPAAKSVFDEVDDALGQSLSHLMFSGDEEILKQTQNAQPAIMAVGMAVIRVLESETGKKISDFADICAGHSLGEYTALCAAKALTLGQTARLLQMRGTFMGQAREGAMAAVLGLSADEITATLKTLKRNEGVCVVANDNCPGQIVISGDISAVQKMSDLLREKGAKRVLPLPVSGAFHSPLMGQAAEQMRTVLQGTEINKPVVPVVSNVTATFESHPEDIRKLLVKQITSPVRWRESLIFMEKRGVSHFVECGNGAVLSGMVKRTLPQLQTTTLNSVDTIRDFLNKAG